jgi:hypothetical protein
MGQHLGASSHQHPLYPTDTLEGSCEEGCWGGMSPCLDEHIVLYSIPQLLAPASTVLGQAASMLMDMEGRNHSLVSSLLSVSKQVKVPLLRIGFPDRGPRICLFGSTVIF